MTAAVLLDRDWSALPPTDRLVTMPPFPMDGTIRTLGVGVVNWMRDNLVQPDGPRAGEPFVPAPDQVDFLLWFYSLDDDARWLFNLGVRRLVKGKGKSPFAAAMALAEFLGPVRLERFDDRKAGGCIGRPETMPLVQIVATAESQTKNTMRYVRAFCPKGGPLARAYNVDVGKTQFYRLPEGTLEVITSSFTAAEGAQATFAVGDEPEHWTPTNHGPELNATILDNLTKRNGRMVHTCNAWKPGIGSVAEDTWDDWVAQEEGRSQADQRILYDARVAPPDTDLSDRTSMMIALEHCYWGSPWSDLETILQRIWRTSAKPDDSKRKFLNWPTAPADAWLDEKAWPQLADPRPVEASDPVVAFFDGSKSRDATAIVCCRVDDGYVFVPQTPDGRPAVWEPDPSHDTEDTVPVADVDLAVTHLFDQHNVVAFFGDVKEWESFVKIDWPRRFGEQLAMMAIPTGKEPQQIAWDMRSHTFEFTRAVELVEAEIGDGQFAHDGNPVLARHVANCRRRPNRYGISIGKESPSSRKKVDAAVCMVGARMVRQLYIAHAAKSRGGKKPGKVWEGGRDRMALSIPEAREVVKQYEDEWRTNHATVDRLDRWMRTDFRESDLPKIPQRTSEEYRELRSRSSTPWLRLVVTAVAQSLYVEGYRTAKEKDDAAGWDVWQANGLDSRQIPVHRGALGHGLAYATVLPGAASAGPMPTIRGVSARSMIAFYGDVAGDDWPIYALRGDITTRPSGTKVTRFRLYDDEAVYTVDVEGDRDRVVYVSHEEHGAGVCPVVRFANELDLDGRSDGEVEPFIPIAARIDQDTFDRLVVQRFGAWKVRTVAGMVEPDTDTEKAAAAVALRIEDLLVSESADTKFGTLDETPLAGYIEARNADIKDLAAVTQTPPHALTGQMVNLSAEALAAAEAGLHRKVVERQHRFGESWEQALRLAQHLRGDTDGAAAWDAQVRWADMESRSLASAADALGKLAQMLGVPVELLWEKIPGFTDQDVDRAKDLRRSGDPMAQLTELLDQQMAAPATEAELDPAAA